MSESLVKASREFFNMLPPSGDAEIEVLIRVDEHTTMELIQADLLKADVFLISELDTRQLICVTGKKDSVLTLLELDWVKKMMVNQRVELPW